MMSHTSSRSARPVSAVGVDFWTRLAGTAVGAPARVSRAALAMSLAVAMCLMFALPAVAQLVEPDELDEADEVSGEPGIELDAEALLRHPGVLPDRLDTPAWVVEPNVGRRLLAVPLRVTPTEEASQLGTSPSISIRGGRFLMWMIEPTDEMGDRSRGRGPARGRAGARGDAYMYDDYDDGYDDYGDMGMMGPRPQRPQPRQQRPQQRGFDQPIDPRGRQADADAQSQLPESAPRFARRVTVQPDGKVQWRLERSLPNAELQDSREIYILRIRPDRLREMQPERPRREAGSNVNRAEMAQRRRESDRAFIEQRRAFNDLRSRVMELPDEFEVSNPARVWAIFEVAENVRELNITGEQPPLPWSVGLDDLETLRSFAGAGGRRGADTDRSMLDALRRVAGDDHPLGSRMVAYAVVDANVISDMEPHDTTYNLLQTLLGSSDDVTRRTVLTALVETSRPTTGVMSLMRHASAQDDPEMKLLSLRGLLQSDLRDANRLAQVVQATGEVLADRDGPDPALVLAELIEAVGQQRGEDVVVYVSANLSFDRLSSDRLTSAARYIVSVAGEQPLAAGWLDRQLLGNASPNIVEQTLEVIAAADAGSPWVRQAAQRGLSALFGPAAEQPDQRELLALPQRIPIHNANHALFRSLNSGHERVRSLAWQSLTNFEFASDDRRDRFRPTQRRTNDDDPITPYDELVDAALGRSPTPPQAAAFLSRQRDGHRAAQAMFRLMLEADENAAEQAARALVGSGLAIGQALADLSANNRVRIGQQLYEHNTGQTPLVVGLLYQEPGGRGRSNLFDWFGQRVAQGSLPMPGEWTEPFRNEDDLIEIAAAGDRELVSGAVAALVYAAGGDDIAVNEQVERFREMGNAGRTQLQDAWASARQEIYARRLAESEGSYRFVALVHSRGSGPAPRGGMNRGGMDYDYYDDDYGEYDDYGPPPTQRRNQRQTQRDNLATEPPTRITLGVVDLQADGRSVSLSNDIVPITVAERELAIRIDRVHALQGFRDEALAELNLDRVREPLDLAPQPDGSWVGAVNLPDGRRLEVRMEPVD